MDRHHIGENLIDKNKNHSLIGKNTMWKSLADQNPMERHFTDTENAFFHDVDIPEIVQLKADIAFSRIMTEKNEREKEMKKDNILNKKTFARLLIGTAACVAMAVSATKGYFRQPAATRKTDMPASSGKEAADSTILSAMDNMFTMYVEAAALTENHPVSISGVNQAPGNDAAINGDYASSGVLGSGEDGSTVSYCIDLPLSCTGNNIEKITYSINNGAFQVVQPEDESIIIDGQLYGQVLNTGIMGGDYDEANGGKPSRDYELVYYQSFTLDYQKQSDPYTWINFCNEVPNSEEAISLLWGDGEYTPEKESKAMQQLLKDTTITCTVKYTDGTEQSSDILVGSQVMAYAEAGKESPTGNSDDLSSFITFELKQR